MPEDACLRIPGRDVLRQQAQLLCRRDCLKYAQAAGAGVVTGVGKQLRGAAITFVSFYLLAVPLALALAFRAGLWVYGLYLGLGAGPLVQAILYGWLVLSVHWEGEAAAAVARAHGGV